MHKKSIEAAHQLKEEHVLDDVDDEVTKSPAPRSPCHDKDELRSESIASLRAKAQTYTAQLRESISQQAGGKLLEASTPSSFQPPPTSSSSSSAAALAPSHPSGHPSPPPDHLPLLLPHRAAPHP